MVDCPGLTAVADALMEEAAAVHVLSGLQARQLADTESLVADLSGSGVGLVTRSSSALGAEFDEVLEHLGAPHLAHLRNDPRVRRDGGTGRVARVARDAAGHRRSRRARPPRLA